MYIVGIIPVGWIVCCHAQVKMASLSAGLFIPAVWIFVPYNCCLADRNKATRYVCCRWGTKGLLAIHGSRITSALNLFLKWLIGSFTIPATYSYARALPRRIIIFIRAEMEDLRGWQEHQFGWTRPDIMRRSPVHGMPRRWARTTKSKRASIRQQLCSRIDRRWVVQSRYVCSWFDQHVCRSQIGVDTRYEREEKDPPRPAQAVDRRRHDPRESTPLYYYRCREWEGEASTCHRFYYLCPVTRYLWDWLDLQGVFLIPEDFASKRLLNLPCLVHSENQKVFKILCHIEFFSTCMKH